MTAAASATPAAPRPDLEGRIYFAKVGGPWGDETIFTADADGTSQRQLTDPTDYCCHDLSPDGTRLMVMTEDQPPGGPITGGSIPADGGNFERFAVTDPTLNLVPQRWSPDGSRIAYEGWDDTDPSRTGVYTARYPDGGDLQRLTSVDGVHDIPSDFSPDGSRVVFYRSARAEPWDVGGSLWVVDSDGSGLLQLAGDEPVPSWWARWSPDGSRILFASARLQVPSSIWTIEPDGTNLTELFNDADGRFPITPTWSPDGTRIMFALDPIADEFKHPANAVYVIAADGTGLTEVFNGSDAKRRFEWLPD